ncbi:MAG: hypothetical protein JSS45_03680 [Proteobacteria bacterium]|nr:hypothetical protein [Pseudomonadota bacterium]
MGKFARSWEMIQASAAVLRSDKELLVFPLVSAIATILVTLTFVLPLIATGSLHQLQPHQPLPAPFYIWMFLFYVVQYTVIFFFNTALVGAAMIRLDGGDPTLADGLAIARSRIVSILGYALIAATVGMILRALEERAGFIGRIVIAMVGAAWTVATSMVVPVLVVQNVGPIDAIKESVSLLRRNWGENLIGNGGIGVVFGLLTFAVALVGGVLTIASAGSMVPMAYLFGALTVVAILGLSLVQAALAGIYSAALYRFASTGQAPTGFDDGALQEAFRIKA